MAGSIALSRFALPPLLALAAVRVPASFVDVPPVCPASPWNTGKTGLADDL